MSLSRNNDRNSLVCLKDSLCLWVNSIIRFCSKPRSYVKGENQLETRNESKYYLVEDHLMAFGAATSHGFQGTKVLCLTVASWSVS